MQTLDRVEIRKEQKVSVAPTLLTPVAISKMLLDRQKLQVVKFRTTCADCLPNY